MSNSFVGTVGNLIEAPVVVARIISRKNWKVSRDRVQRDLYILQDMVGDIFTITMPKHNAIKEGEEFCLKGTIASHAMFSGQRQTHIVAYSLKMKQGKRN
jgi:hypothetical protein